MTSQKQLLSCAFRRLADAIERLSEDNFSKLSDESFNIEVRLTRKRSKGESPPPTHDANLANVIEQLTTFPNREEAQQFLNSNFSTRKAIESIARRLDIPISKQDKVETLRDKVIEATVGARVRSQAIQGNKV